MTPAPSPRSRANRVLRVLGSFHLAVGIFAAMFVVVFIGTWQQRVMSLRDVQRTYFESAVFTVPLFGTVPLPLPGGVTLIAALTVNLVVGGVLRMRLGLSTAGVLVTHVGILVLFVGSAVEWWASDKGAVRLREGDSASVFESYTDWELAIVDVAARREHVVPQDELARASDGRAVTFTSAALPFDVVVSSWLRNADARRSPGPGVGAEGVVLVPLPDHPKQAEANVAACYVDVRARDGSGRQGGASAKGVLWGRADTPFSTEVGGKAWAFELRRRSFELPFAVRLDRAVAREHPGTDIPSEYSSYVTRTAGGAERAVHITMNAPLRDSGVTLYQSSYGKEADGAVFSGFAVVRNPSDRVPIIACAIIGAGMVLHFLLKLSRHLGSQSARRAARSRLASRATPHGSAA